MKIFIVFMFNIYSLILLTFIDNNLQSKNCTHKDYKSKTQGRGVCEANSLPAGIKSGQDYITVSWNPKPAPLLQHIFQSSVLLDSLPFSSVVVHLVVVNVISNSYGNA